MAAPNPDKMIRAYANILVDEGYMRSAMLDLQRETYQLIPKDLGRVIHELRIHGAANFSEIEPSYRDFLHEHEVTFQCDEHDADSFMQIDLSWNSSSRISNCIVEILGANLEFHGRTETLLNELGCTRLLLISDEPLSLADLRNILQVYETSILRSVDVMSTFSDVQEEEVLAAVHEHPRLRSWVLYGAPIDHVFHAGAAGFGQVVSYTEFPDVHCSNSCVDPAYFKSNITLYTESQQRHTFFNAKLFIRPDGSIMNAPNSTEVIGDIHSLHTGAFRNLADHPGLTKYWSVVKRHTDVCKDCEFRNMCVDSRPPLKRNSAEHYHASECNYNPYICKWKGEEGYRSLAECGVVSNAEGFSIDHERIAAINAELWGE